MQFKTSQALCEQCADEHRHRIEHIMPEFSLDADTNAINLLFPGDAQHQEQLLIDDISKQSAVEVKSPTNNNVIQCTHSRLPPVPTPFVL
jgi:hypothetical protein